MPNKGKQLETLYKIRYYREGIYMPIGKCLWFLSNRPRKMIVEICCKLQLEMLGYIGKYDLYTDSMEINLVALTPDMYRPYIYAITTLQRIKSLTLVHDRRRANYFDDIGPKPDRKIFSTLIEAVAVLPKLSSLVISTSIGSLGITLSDEISLTTLGKLINLRRIENLTVRGMVLTTESVDNIKEIKEWGSKINTSTLKHLTLNEVPFALNTTQASHHNREAGLAKKTLMMIEGMCENFSQTFTIEMPQHDIAPIFYINILTLLILHHRVNSCVIPCHAVGPDDDYKVIDLANALGRSEYIYIYIYNIIYYI